MPKFIILTQCHLLISFKLATDEQLTLTENAEDAAIMVSLSTVPLNCRVTLTCVLIREASQPKTIASSDSMD